MMIKKAIDVSFAKGIDNKTDPKRVDVGNFASLENTIFDKGGLLQKRNGYKELSDLPDTNYSYLTTFNGNLTAVGQNIAAYNSGNEQWVSKGAINPLSLKTLPLIRNNLNQLSADSAIAPNGLICTAYRESDGSTTTCKYVIADSVTGQNIIAPTAIPVASGTVTGAMRVYVLGNNFIIVFTNVITAVNHLQYISISSFNPTTVIVSNTDISANYLNTSDPSWDAYVVGNALYVSWSKIAGGTATLISYITNNTPTPVTAVPITAFTGFLFSVTADTTNSALPVIYVTIYKSSTAWMMAVDTNLNLLQGPIQFYSGGDAWLNITSVAQNGTNKVFAEIDNSYTTATGLATHYINSISVTPVGSTFTSTFSSGAGTITASSATGLSNGMYLVDNTTRANIAFGTTFTISGTTLTLSINTAGNSAGSPGDTLAAAAVSSQTTIIRSVGLASKAFIVDGVIYFLAAYSSTYQPTYFLINGSTSLSSAPVIAAKLAYENGGGYLTTGLPNVSVDGTTVSFPYRFKDLIQAVNKDTAVASGTQTAGIYSQTGINLAYITFGSDKLDAAEIGSDLQISGGYLSMYDGYLPVEHNFFLWPDIIDSDTTLVAVWSATGGSMASHPQGGTTPDPNPGAYYYQVVYEWTDNQGNAFRSAPSIPVAVSTTGVASTGSVTLKVATLRLTAKTANPVKIVIYRWSSGQEIYYQTTSISAPTLNSTTTDQVTYVDTHSDATILGNNILYTTGGVVEDVNAPASNLLSLYDTRLWLVNAEDPNTLWYSKQCIEGTPVEMSDLFTIFVPPTVGTATGEITSIFPQDDKFIISKGGNSFVYINGSGPDNTGANGQYSNPVFITSTVGCSNQRSIAFIPDGTMFQSAKGIWILDRGLGTSYIGAPVQNFTADALVVSTQTIPETNQVRFVLDSGITLMYDYYWGQWSTFTGVPAVSSCIYQDMHTFINSSGQVFQENPGHYLDGSNPVLMSFKTAPLRLGDLQNYQRAYFFYLLGNYITPHKLMVSIFYDYSDNPSSSTLISPVNFAPNFGAGDSSSPYGQGSPYGGPSTLEDWRVFLSRQRCMAFAIQVDEIYDPSLGVPAGAGFTMSGINVICGFKSPFRPQSAALTAGTN